MGYIIVHRLAQDALALLRLYSGSVQAPFRLCSGSAQALIRYGHPRLRLKQQLLTSRD
jgi:hypothetical protein